MQCRHARFSFQQKQAPKREVSASAREPRRKGERGEEWKGDGGGGGVGGGGIATNEPANSDLQQGNQFVAAHDVVRVKVQTLYKLPPGLPVRAVVGTVVASVNNQGSCAPDK